MRKTCFTYLLPIDNLTMSYFIAAISNGGGAPEQAYLKMQAAGACPEKPLAGTFFQK
jgi:hypothetical protein